MTLTKHPAFMIYDYHNGKRRYFFAPHCRTPTPYNVRRVTGFVNVAKDGSLAGLEISTDDENDLPPPREELRVNSKAEVQTPVYIDYTNYRGERACRAIVPQYVYFGSNEWHPKPQWLLVAYDVAKQEDREFAMSKIHTFGCQMDNH